MRCPFCMGNGFAPDVFWDETGNLVRRFFCGLCGKSVFQGSARFSEINRQMLKERSKIKFAGLGSLPKAGSLTGRPANPLRRMKERKHATNPNQSWGKLPDRI